MSVYICSNPRGAWLAQYVERVTLDLGGESWRPMLGGGITKNKKNTKI